jgi:phosphoglycerol transferase MdoB-like AlkP superfamily enzyme
MLKALIFFVRFFLIWLLFFLLDRLIFVSLFYHASSAGFGEAVAVIYYGLRLDLATAAYLVVAPLLYFLFVQFKNKSEINLRWVRFYNAVLLIIFSIISVINLNIYREWGSKINAKAIEYALSAPNEAIASSASSPIFSNIAILLALIAFGLSLNKWLNLYKLNLPMAPLWAKTLFTISALSLTFLLIRGGWGVAPNNQSMAYYSDDQMLNHAAINTEWNLLASLLKANQITKNPFAYYEDATAEATIKELYTAPGGSSLPVLTTSRPNVVVIIMESFTADLTRALGNERGITPGFDSLAKQGLLFSRIYATGNRTDKGILGTLAAQPSLSPENMVKWPEKMEKIPAISRELYKNGYQTSFFYGGQSEFDNYKAFVMSHSYQRLVDKSKFSSADMNSKWGAYDGVVFSRQLEELNKTRQPFFSTVMTLTNHEPFEVPGAYKFGKQNNTQRFKSTAFYTDSCITAYLQEAKKRQWYKNTLFIFVADHGHILPKGREDIFAPQRYHIPLLFFGEVIKKEYRGRIFPNTGSQIDIASTLLHQLKIDSTPFKWSKDLLNTHTPPFAFFSWDNGIGFIDNKQCVTFDNVGRRVLYNDLPADTKHTETLLKNAKSYIQLAYKEFLAR